MEDSSCDYVGKEIKTEKVLGQPSGNLSNHISENVRLNFGQVLTLSTHLV